MNRIALFLFSAFCLVPLLQFSQRGGVACSTFLAFEKMHIGTGLHLQNKFGFNQHQFSAGLAYLFPSSPTDDSGKALWNRARPSKPLQSIALTLGYDYTFLTLNSRARFALFANVQFANTTFKVWQYEFELYAVYPPTGQVLPIYELTPSISRPIFVVESRAGIQMQQSLGQRISLLEMFGSGIATSSSSPTDNSIQPKTHFEIIFPYFSIGMGYHWKPLNRKDQK